MSKWSFHRKREEVEERYILAIDGGGMRGIVPAEIIKKIARELKEAGDTKPLYAHFDLIAGTSTGGLIALGLSANESSLKKEEGEEAPVIESVKRGFFRYEDIIAGYIPRSVDPAAITDIYLTQGSDIFSAKNRFFGSVFSDKYDTAGLEKFLYKTFEEKRLKEALVPTLVVSYDTISGKTMVLSSYNEYKELHYSDAARGTSAAPLYFKPKYIKAIDGSRLALIDGGVVANNPSLIAYTEARKLYPYCKVFHILSLSTAAPVYSYDPSDSSGGVSGWAEPMTHIYPNAQADLINSTLTSLPEVDYTRIHGVISEEKIKMDDTRAESMALLKAGADKIYNENSALLSSFIDKLKERKRWDNVRLKSAHLMIEEKHS